jgi:cobalt-zinc-cadmium efflux system membrane fusion protein
MRSCCVAMIFGSLLAMLGCVREGAGPEVEVDVKAAPTGLLRLSGEAQDVIGLGTTHVKKKSIAQSITSAGWLMVKPGNEVQIKAPAAGFVVLGSDTTKTNLGSIVTDRQELGKLHVFLSPQEEAQLVALKEDADILIEQSLASLAIAEDRFDKVKNIQGGTIAGRDLQALQEVVQRSKAAVAEARDKLPFLPPEPYERPLRLDDVAINAPMAGRITEIHVRPRQLVIQGEPLWTVTDWSTLWLRVPVFDGDLPKVDQLKAIEITVSGSKMQLQARPISIPQPTDDGRRTVDLLYEVANDGWQLRPGQSVSARIPTAESRERLVIPQSALLWDGMGNSWVYVRESADTFRRQRVQIGSMQNEAVAIERGLDEEEEVVIVGAEALYGEEFKSQIDIEEDD